MLLRDLAWEGGAAGYRVPAVSAAVVCGTGAPRHMMAGKCLHTLGGGIAAITGAVPGAA